MAWAALGASLAVGIADARLPQLDLSYLHTFTILILTWAWGARFSAAFAAFVGVTAGFADAWQIPRAPQWHILQAVILICGYWISIALFSRLRQMSRRAVAEAQNRYLAEASKIFANTLDSEVTIRSLAELCVPKIADWCGICVVDERGGLDLRAVAGPDPALVELWTSLNRRYPSRVDDGRPLARVVQSRKPKLIADMRAALGAFAHDEKHLEELRRFNLACSMCLPLTARGQVLGTLSLGNIAGRRPFGAIDLRLAEDLALRAAAAIENGQLYAGVRRAARHAEFLSEASKALSASLDIARTLTTIAQLAVHDFADWCAVHLLQDDGTITTAALAHIDPEKAPALATLRNTSFIRPEAPHGAAKVIRESRTERLDLSAHMLHGNLQGSANVRTIVDLGTGPALCVPLIARGKTLGAITFTLTREGGAYGDEDVRTAEELARRAAMAIDNARLYEREHHVADTLQRASLPTSLPEVPGVSFDAAYVPGARESDIGGDWYDAFVLRDGRIAFSIGDVSGRGLQAAVTMGKVRESLRAFSIVNFSPAEILAAADRALQLESTPAVVTAIVGFIDPLTRELCYGCAGHQPPLLGNVHGEVQRLAGGGLPLGLRDEEPMAEHRLVLPEEASLLLYTDGMIERDRDLLRGEAELAAAFGAEIQNAGTQPAAGIFKRIFSSPAADDVALLLIALHPLAADIRARAPMIRYLPQVS